MSRRRCDECGRPVSRGVNACPDCSGPVRVTLDEPGHGRIEYIIRRTPGADPRERK